MKTRIFFMAALLLTAFAFFACKTNDPIEEADNFVRFTTEIDNRVSATPTRATDNSWTIGDEIGIFMRSVSDPITTIESNKRYYKASNENNDFDPVDNNHLYYPLDGEPVNFIAYYPYDGTMSDATYTVQIATPQTEMNQPTFDLLYSSGKTGSRATAATPVNLRFQHKLAKIVMNISKDGSVTKPLVRMGVTIKGMNTQNTFDILTGMFGTESTVEDIITRSISLDEDNGNFDAIILPEAYEDGVVTVEFFLPEVQESPAETYTWTLDYTTFVSGFQYEYDVLITKTKVIVTGSITPWKTTETSNVEAI